MKKSLTKLLARMAKDGDVEAVAEFIEEMIEGEPETPAEAVAEVVEEVAEAAAGAVAEAVSGANNGSTGAIAPEGTEVTVDEDTVAGIIERLDRLIELLTPVPAADEDPEELPAEEVAEVIEEVIEAVEEAESAESAEALPEDNAAEEVAEIVEAILESDVSTTLEEVVEGDEDPDDPEGTCGNDALCAVLNAAAPRLAKMSRKQRRKAAADIAARVKKARGMGSNRGYDRAASAKFQKGSAAYAALGKRIMASRNANYHK